jgi:MFS family permease
MQQAIDERPWVPGFTALCAGQFLANQTGLVFSALIPILRPEWHLSAGQAGLILGLFQLGQLGGYVLVGFLLDRTPSTPIMAWSATLVGAADLAFAFGARGFVSGLILRFLSGVVLGGLYLPGLKYIADTVPGARRGRAAGIYIGVLVAAYAVPLLYVDVLAPGVGWRATIATVGALELVGALVFIAWVPGAPHPAPLGGVGFAQYIGDVLRNRPARRVILAYTGHNWELFGMWGWLTPFLVMSLAARGVLPAPALRWGGTLAAIMIGLGGGVGAVAGGRLSDRVGRARAATLMLTVSFLCSLCFGWLLTAPLVLIVVLGLVYGITALADSPSYSASLMEAVPARSLGGAFSVQMLFGWGATVLAPVVFGLILDATKVGLIGPALPWAAAFASLAVGPIVGIAALGPLRAAGPPAPPHPAEAAPGDQKTG